MNNPYEGTGLFVQWDAFKAVAKGSVTDLIIALQSRLQQNHISMMTTFNLKYTKGSSTK